MEKRYFYQFTTIDYAAAVEFYETNKSTMWEEEEGGRRRRRLHRRQMKVVRGDFHEHASKHGSEEQHEVKTDVEGQDVRNDNYLESIGVRCIKCYFLQKIHLQYNNS